jgi:hypothetical protein
MFWKNKNKKSQGFLDRLLYGASPSVIEPNKSVVELEQKIVNTPTPKVEEKAEVKSPVKSAPMPAVTEKKPEPVPEVVTKVEPKKEEIVVPQIKEIVKEVPIVNIPKATEVKEVRVKLVLQRDIDASTPLPKEVKIHPQNEFSQEKEPSDFLPPLIPKVKFITREKYFNLGNGKHLGSIAELRDVLGTLSEQAWRQYVTEDSNAFANWVDGAFHEYDLGTKLRTTKDKQKSIAILSSFLFRS